MKTITLTILCAIMFVLCIVGCKSDDDTIVTVTEEKVDPEPEISPDTLNTKGDTLKLPKVMAWWSSFNSIATPLDAAPEDIDMVHLFVLDLDARPEVALDSTHFLMHGFTWDKILSQARTLQSKGIKVLVSLMGGRGDGKNDTGKALEYGFPPTVYQKPFGFGAIKDPETYARVIKRKVIDEWGLDGLDLDIEEDYAAPVHAYNHTFNRDSTALTMDQPKSVSNAANFIKALGKYFGPQSGTDKLLVVDRGPYPGDLVPEVHEYFNHVIMQAYNWYDYTSINKAQQRYAKYFDSEDMFFTITASRSPNLWDENPKLYSGFYFQGAAKTREEAEDAVYKYAKIKVPSGKTEGDSILINTGMYQLSGDASFGYPLYKAMRKAQQEEASKE